MKPTQVECALLLDIIIRQGASILKLLAGEDEALLVGRDALLILNLRLDVVNGIGGLHLESDRLSSQRLHEDLHAATKTEDQMESRLLLDVVIRKSSAVLKLFASEDKTLLVGRDALFVLDLCLDVVDRVG